MHMATRWRRALTAGSKVGVARQTLLIQHMRSRCEMAGILFEDIFDVKDIDPDGKKFERGINDSFWCQCVRV